MLLMGSLKRDAHFCSNSLKCWGFKKKVIWIAEKKKIGQEIQGIS